MRRNRCFRAALFLLCVAGGAPIVVNLANAAGPPMHPTAPASRPIGGPASRPVSVSTQPASTLPAASAAARAVYPATAPSAGWPAPPAKSILGKPTTAPAVSAASRPTTAPAVVAVHHPATRPGTEPLLSMDELKQLFDQGKFSDLLRELPRVLVLRGKAAEPYKRYDLLMLKFETQMRLKAQAPALVTLGEAGDVTDDPKKINYSKGVTLLIQRSKNFAYQPSPQKKEKPPTINIIEPETRQKAIKALLADEFAAVGPKVAKALDGTSLTDIAEALKLLQGFDVLDSAAGVEDESTRMIEDLRTRGNAIMAKTVIRLGTRADDIIKSANELLRIQVLVPGPGGALNYETRLRKRGLMGDDWRELNSIAKAADDIIPNARGLAQASGGKVKDEEDLINAAEDLKRKADKAAKANYNDLN